jgi:hypothetical protein
MIRGIIIRIEGGSMKRSLLLFLILALVASSASAFVESKRHLYLCRSPLLAFNFWQELQDVQKKGVTLTPKIAEQICSGMKAGNDPQCIRVEADKFTPVASGWGGAMAMSDGKTKIWFHNPDGGGWIHPDYYVSYVNQK